MCCYMLCSHMLYFLCFFFFKQKTAYEMRISDWSSDVCSSDLFRLPRDGRDVARDGGNLFVAQALVGGHDADAAANGGADLVFRRLQRVEARADRAGGAGIGQGVADAAGRRGLEIGRAHV